jgi:succinoglycan biosynthesis transport protein ExoP
MNSIASPAGTDAAAPQPSRLDKYMPDNQETGETTGFNIGIADLKVAAWRQRWLIGITILVAALIGVVLTLLTTPVYQATSTVRIDQEGTRIFDGQEVDPTVSVSDANRYLTTQRRVIESRAMALRVVDKLKLAQTDEFLVAMGNEPPATAVPAADRARTRREVAAGVLQSGLKVTVPIDNRIASIAFESRDPVIAARVANGYADAFIEANVRRGYESTDYARKVLSEQIELARNRLQDSERQAITYAQRTGLIDLNDAGGGGQSGGAQGGGGSTSLVASNLIKLNGDYVAAQSARIQAEQRWRAAQAVSPLELPEVQANSTVQSLRTERAQAEAERRQLRERYRADYPDVQQLNARILALDGQINQIASQTRNSLRLNYQIALQQERALATARDGSIGSTIDEQRRRVELNLINRNVDTERTQMGNLMSRFNQVSAASDISANNISMLDRATVPGSPVKPKPLVNLALALAAGLALAVVLAFGREALDDTVRSPEDVERKLRLPLLGTTPALTGDDDTIESLADSKSALAEAYYSIRATLDYATSNGTPRTLQITSSSPSEGKSTTSIAIARDYARIGRRALLVDADLRKPSLHRWLNLEKREGFVDVLLGHRTIDQVVQQIDGLHVLTLGKIPPNPVQLLSSNALSDFIQRHENLYDVIIFDSAPVMGLADAPLISRMVEGTLVVVEANRVHRGQAKTAIRRLEETGANLMGAVLTKFDYREAGYGYDYYYSYYSYGKDGNKKRAVQADAA